MAPYGIPALSNQQAWDAYESFQIDERVFFTGEPNGIEATWKAFALQETASPKLWMDAWLAAFAFQSGNQLVTLDKAFPQFPGLDVDVLSLD